MKCYVDGYLLVVPKNRMEEYEEMARLSGEVWMKHGALSYVESVGEDLHPDMGDTDIRQFDKLTGAGADEEVIFAFATYRDRAHRDEVNEKVMNDPKMNEICDPENMPFEMKKMTFGGFKSIVGF